MKFGIFLALIGQVLAYGDVITGCDSRCSIVFDKNPDCLTTAVDYHTKVLFGSMRNYVSAQLNVQKSSQNTGKLTKEQLVQNTVSVMGTVSPTDQSDQKDVLSASEAQPIVDALVDNVEAQDSSKFWPFFCHQGCEKSSTLFKILTICSLGLNGFFFMLGGTSVVMNYWKDVKYARNKKDLTPGTTVPLDNRHAS